MDTTIGSRHEVSRRAIGFRMAALLTLPVSLAVGLIAAFGGTPLPAAIGIPVAVMLVMGAAGWLLAPAVAPPPSRLPILASVGLGVVAVVVAATCIGLIAAATDIGIADVRELTPHALAIAGFGLMFLGLPALAITVPLGFVWAAVVRARLGEEADKERTW